MCCPKCGVILHLDPQSKETNMSFNTTKFGKVPEGFYQCWGCGFARPEVWWDAIELDVHTEIKFPEEKKEEELPEELTGYCESPWAE